MLKPSMQLSPDPDSFMEEETICSAKFEWMLLK